MLAIISAPGSRGDVNPMIAIGQELSRRGHEVVISLAETYAPLARRAGLEPIPMVSSERFDEILSDPTFWRPLSGLKKVIEEIVKDFLEPHYKLIAQRHRAGETVLISHPLDFSSRIFRDQVELPLIDVHLAPMLLATPEQPPRLTPFSIEIPFMRWAFRLSYWLGDRIFLAPLLTKPINDFRMRLGLPNVRRVMQHWWFSPDRVFALYPEWFAPATVGFLPQLRHAGFPLQDLTHHAGEPSETHRPIDPRTVVFTAGTANHHTRDFFEHAASVCRRLNIPGLLLSTHHENFPDGLPANVTTQSYAPLGDLLPQCGLIVHHGGIGTTSQALASGTGQIIRPLAFDQFDNATRVERLGCGRWLRNELELERTIDELSHDETLAAYTDEVQSRFRGQPSAACIVADEAERMLEDRQERT